MKRTELLLVSEILRDVGLMCSASIDKDIDYLMSRVKEEGLQFLTITLPTFAKGIERCLEQGFYDPSLFRPFRKKRSKNGVQIPSFLSGITSQIFDASGVVRDDCSVDAVDGIRQICLVYNKTKKECSNGRKAKAIQAFRECERDIGRFRVLSWADLNSFDRISRIAFGRMFSHMESQLLRLDLLPKHGPGAVANAVRGNGKYRTLDWTKRLDRIFPADHYLFANHDEWIAGREGLRLLETKDEPPVKVVFVPKTQKTPRVIAIEPSWNQFCQQSLMRPLVEYCESDPILKGSIHFTNSKINGELARESSITRTLATLDMSEASDRVHASLVHRLVRDFPHLTKAVFSSRSKCARLPDGDIIRLKKFASMGSALCFPFEAFVFYTLALIGLHKASNLPISRRTIEMLSSQLHVFGDDLVIPSMGVQSTISTLESVGLKVNRSKTFVSGYFRESCGVDAFKGYSVTPVYIRTDCPNRRQDATEISSYLSSSNLFYKKGYWMTAKFMRERILDRIYPFPHTKETSPLLGYYSFKGSYNIERWNKKLFRFESKGLSLSTQKSDDSLKGYRRLFKFFLERGSEPISVETFDRSTRRGSVYTKSRWNTPF